MRRGRRKALCNRKRDSLEGPQEEAEIKHNALRREKNLAFSEDTCTEKKVCSQKWPRESWSRIKAERGHSMTNHHRPLTTTSLIFMKIGVWDYFIAKTH